MSQKTPLASPSVRQSARPSPEPAPVEDSTPKIIAAMAVIVALAVAVLLLKASSQMALGVALVGVTASFAVIYHRTRSGEEEDPVADYDAAGEIVSRLEAHRSECNARLAELRRALDACRTDNAAARENAAIREEITKLRNELAGLRATAARRWNRTGRQPEKDALRRVFCFSPDDASPDS